MSTIYEPKKFGNPILREKAVLLSIEEISSIYIKELIMNMQATLAIKQFGVGLSAPQVGVSKALIVLNVKPTPTLPDLEEYSAVMINPVIIETFGEHKNMLEGCISAGESGDSVCAKVPRPNKVKVKWLDEYAEVHEQIFEGFVAHTIQHEIDHLEGILFVDRVVDTKSYILKDEFTLTVATTNETDQHELRILSALYDLYKLNLDNKPSLKLLSKTAWTLGFGLDTHNAHAFHSLSEAIESTEVYGPNPFGDDGGHYTEIVEDALKRLEKE
jgi:peptide deformylase